MSSFWIILELRIMDAVVITGAIRCAKLQSNHHHQQTNTQLFHRPDAFLLSNSVIAQNEKISTMEINSLSQAE